MTISKTTSVTYLTTSGVEFDTLISAKYREMADLFLTLFANAGLPTGNNISMSAATTLGQYFVDASSTSLTTINQSINATRNANP